MNAAAFLSRIEAILGICLIGCGKALPALEVPNQELEHLVDTNDEWISSRTGISSRRVSIDETCTDLAAVAACEAMGASLKESLAEEFAGIAEKGTRMERSGWSSKAIDPASIDLIVLTSVTPDAVVPSNACLVRRALGCEKAIAFDLNAACTGFIYALSVAQSMMTASHAAPTASGNIINRALVVSAERLTRITNWADRNTCVLFGDGAGAAVLEWQDDAEGLASTYLANADDAENSLVCKNSFTSWQPFEAGGVMFDEKAFNQHRELHPDPKDVDYSYIESLGAPFDTATESVDAMLGLAERNPSAPEQTILMDGQRVFKFAARSMESAIRKAAEVAGVEVEDIDLIVPHQANLRIIEFAAKRLHLPMERFQVSIGGTGNTSSSGVPMALTDALSAESAKPGDLVALVAFGGGLTNGAAIIRI